MHAKPSFTGRSRRRTTHPWVRYSDTIARAVITLGGIGTIVAVLAVGVFLLAVAAPLFTSATAALDRVAPLADGHAAATRAVADRNRGRATARRKTPTSSTATIVPMPPSVITARATASPTFTPTRVTRRRVLPVKVRCTGSPRLGRSEPRAPGRPPHSGSRESDAR